MTSALGVKEIQAASGSTISVIGGNILVPSTVIQVKYVRMDNRIAYTAQTSGTGTRVPELAIGIAPKNPNSIILLSWMLNVEANENTNWTIHEGTSPVHGEADRAHGIVTQTYDADVSTTPNNLKLMFWVPAQSTEYRRYTPAHKSSNTAANTVTFNRSISWVGQDSGENMICTGVAMELTP
jgi:hypothetical protein